MASPQIVKGYTSIPNELLKALYRVNLSPYEWRILLVIMRKTYGWGKRTDRITVTQFQTETCMARQHVSRTIKRLVDRGMVYRVGEGYLLQYGVQENYEEWKQGSPEQVTNNIADLGDGASPEQVTNNIADLGDGASPEQVTISKTERHLNRSKSSPVQDASVTYPGDEIVTDLGDTQKNKETNKNIGQKKDAIRKANRGAARVETYEEFREKLKEEFRDIPDVEHQIRCCEQWHDDHHPRTAMRDRKSALLNWLTKEHRQIHHEEANNDYTGINRRDFGATGRRKCTTVEELKRGARGADTSDEGLLEM